MGCLLPCGSGDYQTQRGSVCRAVKFHTQTQTVLALGVASLALEKNYQILRHVTDGKPVLFQNLIYTPQQSLPPSLRSRSPVATGV